MAPSVTLGVLFDQIVPADDSMDQEEIAIRERLRGLVLAFMTNEAKETINQNPKLNNQFAEGLTLVRYSCHLSSSVTHFIRLYHDWLMTKLHHLFENTYSLCPCLVRVPPQGDLLLQAMIRKLEASDLKRSPLSPTTRSYLSLAHHLTVDKKNFIASGPSQILLWYPDIQNNADEIVPR